MSFNKLVKKQVSTIGKKEVPKNVFINEEEELKPTRYYVPKDKR